MKFSESKSFAVSEDILCQEIGSETVLLDMRGEVYFGLDAVGSRIWQLLKERSGFERVISILDDEFDVSTSQLRTDVEELLSSMLDKGLVTFQ